MTQLPTVETENGFERQILPEGSIVQFGDEETLRVEEMTINDVGLHIGSTLVDIETGEEKRANVDLILHDIRKQDRSPRWKLVELGDGGVRTGEAEIKESIERQLGRLAAEEKARKDTENDLRRSQGEL